MITTATAAPSKIAATVADTLLASFSGQTVTIEEAGAEITNQYAMARTRCTFGSFVQVTSAMERAGMFSHWSGPGYTGVILQQDFSVDASVRPAAPPPAAAAPAAARQCP